LAYLGLFGLILAYWLIGLFMLIWTYLDLFGLIWALIGSFDFFQLAVPAKSECAHLSESYFKLISMQRIIEAYQIQD